MIDRKELKQNGRRSLKKNYWLFVAICLIAVFMGSEFGGSLDGIRANIAPVNVNEYSTLDSAKEGLGITNANVADAVITNLIQGQAEERRRISEKVEKNLKSADGNRILERQKGVFADLANSISSGKIYVDAFDRATRVFKSKSFVVLMFVIITALYHLALLFMLKECYVVTTRRLFLEGRIYDKVPLYTFVYLVKSRKWIKSAFTMMLTFVYKLLWGMTVIAIPIKHYSYFMVPYIVAENPDIRANEAITLSRHMMKGHKWECFRIFLSFIPWFLLDYISLGLVSVFYSNAYRTAVYCEYYVKLRKLAKEKGLPYAEKLNDTYLFQRPELSAMEKSYADVMHYINEPVPEARKAKGIRGFMENWLGVMLLGTPGDLEYEKEQARADNIRRLKYVFDGKIYPARLSPLEHRAKKISLETPNYIRNYSIPSLVLMFFIFSFIGWTWEVSLHLVKDGVFINRGTMYGPWLPIYGAGGVLILILLNKFRRNPLGEFFAAVILSGFVEYFTSLYLEMTKGLRWWDYSGYFLNLDGRICAEGLITFGLGGMAVVYALAPSLDNMIRKIKLKVLIPVCLALICIFAADQMYSSGHPNEGKGISDYSMTIVEDLVIYKS